MKTLFTLLLVLIAAPSVAQTLAWDQPLNGLTVAEASALTYTLKVDSAAPVAVTASCTAAPVGAACTAPLPATILTTLSTGRHTITLTAANAFGSATSAPITGAVPGTPGVLKVTITVTIG